MVDKYANEFNEILPTLAQNYELRQATLILVGTEPMPGKVTEGEDRLEKTRLLLSELINGEITIQNAFTRIEHDIPQSTSAHSINNRVFASGWGERLVRIQLSRFYNQAVMAKLIADGETDCYVPHSSLEDSSSKCSITLAGKNHPVRVLYGLLIDAYRNGDFSQKTPRIPDHPHCTHVVRNVQNQK